MAKTSGNSKTPCPCCGEEYTSLGGHWRYHDDHRPELTQEQWEILTGIMLGDGTAERSNDNAKPRIQCNCIEREYLEWIDEKLGVMGTGVSIHQSSKSSAIYARESGFDESADAASYSTVYAWATRSHEPFTKFLNWYDDNGVKHLPEDLELTPTVLKHWYCGDGNVKKLEGYEAFELSTTAPTDGKNRSEYLADLFAKFDVTPRINKNGKNVYFDKSDSEKLYSLIGNPVPGYEYKFPTSGD